jgi:hypothetical protein
MAATSFPDFGPRRYRRAWVTGLVFVFLGLISLAAVGAIAGQCRTENDHLLVDTGSRLLISPGNTLLTGTQTRRCELSGWRLRFELSERAEAILRKLGVRFSYI